MVQKTLLSIFAFGVVASAAQAQFVNPATLHTSPDGHGLDVQTLLNTHGQMSSVGTSAPDYGDQAAGRLFQFCAPGAQTWSMEWQNAGYAPRHMLGYYTDVHSANPAITWVLGGSATGLPTTATVSISGVFGLAFGSGDNGNPLASTVYYSETNRNSNGDNRVLVTKDRHESGYCETCGLTTTWEDGGNMGDRDYNDFGLHLQGVQAVPEPTSMAVIGLGVVGLMRRKNRKQK